MMTTEQVLDEFRAAGALLQGHFILSSGLRSPVFLQKMFVEDIVTTGLSSRECIEAIREFPGDVVGAACLIDRSSGKAELGVPLISLAALDIPTYPADALPPELAAIPPVKPGSRALKA